MNSRDIPAEEPAAATDEFFKHQPVLPQESEAADNPITPLSPLPENCVPSTEDETTHPSVVEDYVRELQQEYEDQEQEGKI